MRRFFYVGSIVAAIAMVALLSGRVSGVALAAPAAQTTATADTTTTADSELTTTAAPDLTTTSAATTAPINATTDATTDTTATTGTGTGAGTGTSTATSSPSTLPSTGAEDQPAAPPFLFIALIALVIGAVTLFSLAARRDAKR